LKKNKLVFDTGPLFLYFAGDEQVKQMFNDIKNYKTEGYTCETNLTELYYKTCEKLGRQIAQIRYASIRNVGFSIMPIDEKISYIAANLKCVCRGKLSLVDAYIVALAKQQRGTLITTDPRISELNMTHTKLLHL
jgi:hypothetical protein